MRGPNAGERFFGPQAELTLLDANGNLIASPTFSQPITLCYTYDPTDLATVGNSGAFSIELLNTATNQWQRLTTTPDTANSRVCTQLSHFSSYVLGGRLATPSSLPNTGTAAQPLVGAWLWVLLAVALGAGASIKARMIQRTVVPAPVLAKETEASETSIKE